MSERNPYRLFVAHEFGDSAEYSQVFEYLESRNNFFYLNYSDPDAARPNAASDVLQEVLRAQIRDVEAVIVPASMCGSPAGLVDFELRVAQAFKKPIIAVRPFGGATSVPSILLDAAAEVVEWDEREIIAGIRRAARGEDTSTWDVIEFEMEDFKLDESEQ